MAGEGSPTLPWRCSGSTPKGSLSWRSPVPNISLFPVHKRSFEELENTPMPALFLCSSALKKPKGVNTIWNLRGQTGNLGFHVYSQKQYGQNAFRPMPLLIWTAHTPSLNLFLQVRCVHFCEKKKNKPSYLQIFQNFYKFWGNKTQCQIDNGCKRQKDISTCGIIAHDHLVN